MVEDNTNSFLSTSKLIEKLRRETGYAEQGYKATPLAVRCNNNGQANLVTMLIGVDKTYVTPVQILIIDIKDGRVFERRDAADYYRTINFKGELGNSIPIARNIRQDDTIKKIAPQKTFELMDEIRRQFIEKQEIGYDIYIEYLYYALYSFSDEFSKILLPLSRTSQFGKNMKVSCRECSRSYEVNTAGIIPETNIKTKCPVCGKENITTYKRTKLLYEYTNSFFKKYRSSTEEKNEEQKDDKSDERIIDTSTKFEISTDAIIKSGSTSLTNAVPENYEAETITEDALAAQWKLANEALARKQAEKEKEEKTEEKDTSVEFGTNEAESTRNSDKITPVIAKDEKIPHNIDNTDSTPSADDTNNSTEDSTEITEDYAKMEFDEGFEELLYKEDGEDLKKEGSRPKTQEPTTQTTPRCEGEEEIIGLDYQKKVFELIRRQYTLRNTPSHIYALIGGSGCGIDTSVRTLSGFNENEIGRYSSAEEIGHEKCLIITLADRYDKSFVKRLIEYSHKEGYAIFVRASEEKWRTFIGETPAETNTAYISQMIMTEIRYNIPKKEDVIKLFEKTLAAYGMELALDNSRKETLLSKAVTFGDAKHLAGMCAMRAMISGRRTVTEQNLATCVGRIVKEVNNPRLKPWDCIRT